MRRLIHTLQNFFQGGCVVFVKMPITSESMSMRPGELATRQSRPNGREQGMLAMRLECRCWQLGDCRIDEARQRIDRAGRSQPVRLKLLAVLVCLIERYPSPVSPDELLAEVWGEYETVGRQGVANAIWALRRLLGDDTGVPQFIETIPRRGYRLLMPARLLGPQKPMPEQASA